MKEREYDLKAGVQRFTYDKKELTINVPIDASNPIDTRLRQIALQVEPRFDFKKEFHDKWAVVLVGDIRNLTTKTGRIKDMYFITRDVRVRTRKNIDIIAPFDRVIAVSEREP